MEKIKNIKRRREPKPYEEHRSHFIQRLEERYSIIISDSEYDELVEKLPSRIILYSLNSVNSLVYIQIKDRYVLCVYGKKCLRFGGGRVRKKLITCLNVNSYPPCPKFFRSYWFDRSQFENEMNKIISEVFEAYQYYTTVNKKEFFCNPKYDLPIKTAAHYYSINGSFKLNKLIGLLANRSRFKILE